MSVRHYGLEIGDIVEIGAFGSQKEICEVLDFAATDNNGCFLKSKDGKIFRYVCEWCRKVESEVR